MVHFIYHKHSFLSREHMNPQLTCSQRQWLHSSVGRASHRYREVTGSNPVEVLNVFFLTSLRNCINCVSLLRLFLHFMLGVVSQQCCVRLHGAKSLTGFKLAQQHTTTSNNVGSCWPTMLRPFARSLRRGRLGVKDFLNSKLLCMREPVHFGGKT